MYNNLGSCDWCVPLQRDNVPISYRNHPFWISSNTMLRMSDCMKEWQEYLESFAADSADSIKYIM